jgi:hypothetical protein
MDVANINQSSLECSNTRKIIFEMRDPFFSSIGIMISNSCNINCRHCIFDIRNKSPRKELPWSQIKKIITQCSIINPNLIIKFTGGEPFLRLETLEKSINLCTKLGLNTSVVTNGYWANNQKNTHEILNRIRNVKTICVSSDIFHQEFIPIGNIRNIITVCIEFGIKCWVRVCYLNDPITEIDSIKSKLSGLEDYYELKHQPVIPWGRSKEKINNDLLFRYDTKGLFCTSDTPLIDSKGNVFACCGPAATWKGYNGLLLGNIMTKTLKTIRDKADMNPIIHALRLWGPREIISIMHEEFMKTGIAFTHPSLFQKTDICLLCQYFMNNYNYNNFLEKKLFDPAYFNEIAFSRMIELGEVSMVLSNKVTLQASTRVLSTK